MFKKLFTLSALSLLLVSSCSNIRLHSNDVLNDNRAIYYYVLTSVREERKAVIIDALKEFQTNVPCIKFVEFDPAAKKIDPTHILYYISVMALPSTSVGADGDYIGLNFDDLHISSILLADNFTHAFNDIVKFDNDYYFKIVIHETAHALGMKAHAFPVDDKLISNLTPKIDFKSSKLMSKKDIDYLDALICNLK